MKALRGLAAAIALLALVVGVPVLLAVAVGWPLPRTIPVWSDITSTFAGDTPLDAEVVWKGLAVIVWIGWAQLAVAVIVEVLAGTRGRVAAVLPGGFGPAQALAAWLLGTAGALLPAGPTVTPAEALPPAAEAHALATTPTPAVAAGSNEVPTTADPANPTVAAPANIDHVVVRRDTLWDLAETYLAPGGTRDDIAAGVQQIFNANVGRPQPDGTALTDASLLRPGWILTIPTAGPPPAGSIVGLVTVERGDSLWEIADEHLGDGNAWPAIADANYGRPQPDGRTLTDPNVLEAGWQLDIPQPATDAAPIPEPTPTADPPPPAAPAPAPVEPTVPADPTIPPTTAPATTTPVPSPTTEAPPADDDPADESDAGNTVPWGLAGGGLATAGLLAILDRRRRAQLRHREPGRRVRLPDEAIDLAERTLRAGADPYRADLVADALRAAAANSPDGLPTLDRVEINDDDIVALVLDDPAPSPPGFDPAGPVRWERHSAATFGDGADLAAPVPALVPIGRAEDGTDVLIDLEATAVTQVTGDPARVIDLLHAVAVAAATAPWADQPHVLTVGAPPSIAEVPGIEPAESFSEALDVVEAHHEQIAAGLRSAHLDSTAQARATGTAPDAWETLVLISTHPPDDNDTSRLTALADTPGQGIAVICPGRPGSTIGRHLTVTGDGRIAELDGATAQQLADDDLDAIATLLQSELELDDSPPSVADDVDSNQVSLEDLLDEGDVVVRVLGEVDARRRDSDEQLATAKQKGLEAIVYLAVRDGSVDREDVQAALWPTGANAAKTFVNVMSDARRTLAAGRDGSPLLPSAEDGRYHLSSRVITDYELFCRLAAAADDIEDARTAAELLADALTLVRGEPFTGAGRGYAWVAPHRGMIVAQVVDAAEELAEVRLATGDWRGAEWAARQGLRAFPADERLYRILMRAAHCAGSLPGVHRAYQELLAAVADPDDGCEPEDTVHPETVQLLESLTASTRPDRATA